MFRFKTYLTEAVGTDKLKHLHHAEELMLNAGAEGFDHSINTLNDVHEKLTGKNNSTKLTTKYDGSPSVVFGRDPKSGEFFVASKSAFNKKPKINYSDEDIDRNHGHAPGLVTKLKAALKHLPSIAPEQGVYQGDLMYSDGDVQDDGKNYSFTPNTITYGTPKDSEHGKAIASAKLGVVVHTKYVGSDLDSMKATFDFDPAELKTSKNVHVISHHIDPSDIKYTGKKKYEKTIKEVGELRKGLSKKDMATLENHGIHMMSYINSGIRTTGKAKPSAQGYEEFLAKKAEKEAGALKSVAAKARVLERYQTFIDDINAKPEKFDLAFKLHDKIAEAKHVLVDTISSKPDFEHTIKGKPAKPEGFVATRDGNPVKLVDREEFSRANFEAGAEKKAAKVAPPEKLPPPKNKDTVVFAFGRMNPPTTGHEVLVNHVIETARRAGSDHMILLSRSNDPNKNPLNPDQKLKYAKAFFPHANIAIAPKDAPTIMSQMVELNKKYKNVIVIAGEDRVPEFETLLNKYNGKDFNFNSIQVVTAGHRDPDAEGTEGMSASKMRKAVADNDFETFKQGIPGHVDENIAKTMFHEVATGMSSVKAQPAPAAPKQAKQPEAPGKPREKAKPEEINIDGKTPLRALAQFGRRKDRIGMLAKKELERRRKVKG